MLIGCIIKVVKSSKEDVIQLMSQIIQTEMTENMLTNSNVDQLTGSKNINSNNFTIQKLAIQSLMSQLMLKAK